MKDAQHASLNAYLRDLADALLLRDWEIDLERAWANDDSYATINVWDVENHAQVKVCEGFFGHPPEEQREWLVHELIHAHLDRPDRIVKKLADANESHGPLQFAKVLHQDEIEICTQRLARIIAPFMPLPPEARSSE